MDQEQAQRFDKIAEEKAALNDEAERLQAKEAARREEAERRQFDMNYAMGGFGHQPMGMECGELNPKLYRPSTLERIEKELAAHKQEATRAVKLEALHRLLKANPDVARILELKAELGF